MCNWKHRYENYAQKVKSNQKEFADDGAWNLKKLVSKKTVIPASVIAVAKVFGSIGSGTFWPSTILFDVN